MLKKFLGASFVVGMTTLATAQITTNLVANTTAVSTGADNAAGWRNSHFTFDLQGSTTGADWTGSEISVDVVGTGTIWHASNQRIATNNPPSPIDPNNPPTCYLHNLNTPGLAAPGANNNTLMYDTFFTSPGSRFTTDPTFASPGLPAPDQASCPAQPPIVSTATRIRGTNPSGAEIPLSWFDTATAALNNTVLARFTFEVPAANGGLVAQATSLPAPAGKVPLARLFGRTTTANNSLGTGFDVTIYQVPEPSTVALLALGGLAGLIRRR